MSDRAMPSGEAVYPATLKEREWWVNWVLAVPLDDNDEPDFDAVATKQPVAPYKTGSAKPTQWNSGLSDEEHPSTDYETVKRWDGLTIGQDIHAPERVLSDELGIGIIPVTTADEVDITLIDWDDVRDPETGKVHPVCARALEECDGYAEISQSGEGIHQFVFGEIPAGMKKFLRHIDDEPFVGDDLPMVEMYSSGRLTAMTGTHVEGTGTDLVDGQDLIDDLCWAYGRGTNNATDTPSDPFAEARDGDDDARPSHDEVSQAIREAVKYDGDDPVDWDLPDGHSTEYHAVLRARERSDELPNTANWELIGYATALGKRDGLSKKRILDDLRAHETPQYGFDESREPKEVRSVWRKVSAGNYETPSVSLLKSRGILPPDYIKLDELARDDTLAPKQVWDAWSSARLDGQLGAESVIPNAALRHVAESNGFYDFDALPEDVDELPAKAHNRALHWVKEEWWESEQAEATARHYKKKDPDAVRTWEDVRYIYRESKEEGRYAAVQLLRSRYDFATPMDTQTLYVYDDELGIYDETATLKIDRELDRNLGSFYRQHELSEIKERLKAGTYTERDRFEAGDLDGHYVCVKNGVLDLDNRELLDHDPEYLFTSLLPHRYDADARAERIETFLEEITARGPDKRTLLEVLGNALLPNYKYELVMILFGEGSNGKGTWFDVMRNLLGKENTTSMSLQRLAENQFAGSNLVGKWAVLGEDLPEKKITDMGTVKDLSGGGATHVEPKGEQGFDLENRAKLMFSANRPPVLGEKSLAVKRRLVPIHLPNQFVPDPDPDDPHQMKAQKEGLEDELLTEEEMSGLLNLALDGLERLRENGDVSLPESYDERLEYYEQFSDPIKEFAVNCLENVSGDEELLEKQQVYNAYTEFCNANDYDSTANNWFWQELRQTTFNVAEYRPYGEGERTVYLRGANFSETAGDYIPSLQDEDSATDSEEEEGDAPDTPSPTPIDELNGWGNPFHTVTAEVTTWSRGHRENGPAYEGALTDATGTIELVDWTGCNAFAAEIEEGRHFRIRDVKVSFDSNGTLRLEPVKNTTTAEWIQKGVGTTGADNPGDSQQLPSEDTAATDGGSAATTAEADADPTTTVPADAEGRRADVGHLCDIL